MRKIRLILILATAFVIPPCFANDQDMSSSDSKPCAAIAQACLKGGFTRTPTAGKKFWQDCMKPIILGKTVQGVTVDATTVKACRVSKIDKLKKELDELQKVS